MLGYGQMVSTATEIDPDIYNAAGQFVALKPGASFFDSVTSFEMARGGWIDTVILGAYEVDENGERGQLEHGRAKRGGIGGAMDLLSARGDLIIVMEHTDSKGRPKLVERCDYPLTGKAASDYVVTDLALLTRGRALPAGRDRPRIHRRGGGLTHRHGGHGRRPPSPSCRTTGSRTAGGRPTSGVLSAVIYRRDRSHVHELPDTLDAELRDPSRWTGSRRTAPVGPRTERRAR